MFNLGNKDKEELEDNIEDIKEMVKQGSEKLHEGQAEQIEEMEKELRQEELDDEKEEDQLPEDIKNFEPGEFDPVAGEAASEKEEDEQVEDAESFEEELGAEEEFEPQPEQVERQEPRDVENRGRESSGESPLDDAIPEPPETKQLNVPEIEKGPLFIRRKKFSKAREMIEEMHYLAREIEQVVNDLEAGIEQDKKIERDAKELLHRMQEDRFDITEIISPGEE